MLIIGVDPAKTGSAVILQDVEGHLSVAVVFLWQVRTRKKQKVFILKEYNYKNQVCSEYQYDKIVKIGVHISEFAKSLHHVQVKLVAEDCFVRINPKVAINLARLTGRIVAPIELAFDIKAKIVTANNWRKKTCNAKAFTKRAKVKNISLLVIPTVLPCISEALHVLGQHDHITDACGIALSEVM